MATYLRIISPSFSWWDECPGRDAISWFSSILRHEFPSIPSDHRWPCPGSWVMSNVTQCHKLSANHRSDGTNQSELCNNIRSRSVILMSEAILTPCHCLPSAMSSCFLDRANVSTGTPGTSNTRPFEFCVWLPNGKWDIAWQAGKFPARYKTFTKVNTTKWNNKLNF